MLGEIVIASKFAAGNNVLCNCTNLRVHCLSQVECKGTGLVRRVAGKEAYTLKTVNIIHC